MDRSKRKFLKHYFKDQLVQIIGGVREGIAAVTEENELDAYFDSYESSYALTLAYPDDILLETARQHGIETDGREKADIIKELFNKKGGDEYRF